MLPGLGDLSTKPPGAVADDGKIAKLASEMQFWDSFLASVSRDKMNKKEWNDLWTTLSKTEWLIRDNSSKEEKNARWERAWSFLFPGEVKPGGLDPKSAIRKRTYMEHALQEQLLEEARKEEERKSRVKGAPRALFG